MLTLYCERIIKLGISADLTVRVRHALYARSRMLKLKEIGILLYNHGRSIFGCLLLYVGYTTNHQQRQVAVDSPGLQQS